MLFQSLDGRGQIAIVDDEDEVVEFAVSITAIGIRDADRGIASYTYNAGGINLGSEVDGCSGDP